MIRLAELLLRRIEDAAEAAYPEECCGLLIGRRNDAGDLVVTQVEASPNTATDGRRRFEVDPQLRFDLMRRLADMPEDIIGHYHSHPDEAAAPSATDRGMIYEPDLVWLITAVEGGRAAETRAYAADAPDHGFREMRLTVDGDARVAEASR